MSDNITIGNRRRSNSGPPPPVSGVVTSENATNLFETLGKTVKVPPPRRVQGQGGKDVSPGMDKAAAEQRKYWYDQIRATTAAITKDIENLAAMPEQLAYANGFRKRLKTLAPGSDLTVQELMACSGTLGKLQTEVHDYVALRRENLKSNFKATKEQRAKYEKLHGELAEMEKRLEAYPPELNGTVGKDGRASFVATQIAPGRKKAEQLYEFCHFEEALAELQKVHALARQQLKELDGRDDDLRGGLLKRGPFVAAYKALDELNGAISDAAGVAGEPAVKPFRQQASGFYTIMMKAATRKAEDQKQIAEQLFKTIEAKKLELRKSVEDQKMRRTGLTNALETLGGVIVERGPVRPQSELDEASGMIDEIRSLMARFDYDAAEQMAEVLGKMVLAWPGLPDPKDPSRKEAIGKKGIELFRNPARVENERAAKFAALADSIPVLGMPPTPQSVIDMLDTQFKMFEGDQDGYPVSQGIDSVARAKALNDSFQERIDAYAKLAQLRKDHDAVVQRLLKETVAAIDAFKAKLAKAGTVDATLPTYDAPLNRARDEWAAAMQRATEATALDEVLAAVSLQLQQIRQQAEADIDDPDKLIDATLDARLAQLDAAFRTADEQARKAVAELVEVDYDKADTQRVAADKARENYVAARKKQDVKGAQAALTALQNAGKTAAEQAEAGSAERANVLKTFFDANSALSSTRAKLSKAAESGPCKDYAPVLKALEDKQVMIGRLGKSQDASVIALGLRDLEALQAECKTLAALFEKLSTKGAKPLATDLTIDNLNKRLDEIKLKDATVKAYEAAALADIVAKKDTVKGAVGSVLLSESDRQISDLAQEWADLQSKAEKHKTAVEVFRADVATTLNAFIKTTDKKKLPAYWESVTAQLKALDVAADKEKLTDQKALDQIKKDIAFNSNAGETGLRRANDQCEADALKEELEKQQFLVELAAFEGKIKALDAVLQNIDDPEAKKSFKAQRDQTVTAMESITGSTLGKVIAFVTRSDSSAVPYSTKREQLAALAKNVNNMIRYPMGLETHARGQIVEVVQKWDAAVRKFHELLDALPGKVDAAMKDDPNKAVAGSVVEKVTARVGQLKVLLAPGTMTASAKAVVAADKDKSAAREAREVALREVARLRSLVEGAAFKSSAGNPFKVDILTGLSALSASLFDVETNLTISL